MSAFTERLSRDLTNDPRKTIALGLLLLVGLYFWLPGLLPAQGVLKVWGNPEASVSTETPAAATAAEAVSAAKPGTRGWQVWDRERETGRLFQSADPQSLPADPFTIHRDSLPLVVEFADEPAPEPVAAAPAEPETMVNTEESPAITLQSTLVGPTRQVAIIDGMVYTEGSTLETDAGSWTVLTVEPNRVVLQNDSVTTELTLDPFGTSKARNP